MTIVAASKERVKCEYLKWNLPVGDLDHSILVRPKNYICVFQVTGILK